MFDSMFFSFSTALRERAIIDYKRSCELGEWNVTCFVCAWKQRNMTLQKCKWEFFGERDDDDDDDIL